MPLSGLRVGLRVGPFFAAEAVGFGFSFFDEFVEFAPRQTHGVGFVPEDFLGGGFDVFLEFLDPAGGGLLGGFGLFGAIVKSKIPRFGEGFTDLIHHRLAHRLVESIREERLGDFGLLAERAHLFDDFLELRRLIGERLGEITTLALGCGVKVLIGGLSAHFFHGFTNGLLLLGESTGGVAQGFHLTGELARGLFAEFLLHLFELLLRTGRGVGRLGEFTRLKILGSLANVLAGLVELLFFFAHIGAVLLGVHALGEVVDFAEQFALLFLEAFELPLDLGFFLFGSVLKLILKFFDLLGNGLLTAGEVFEFRENSEILLLLGSLGGILGDGVLLVFQLFLLELEVHVLLLTLLRLAGRLALRHGNLHLAGAGLDELGVGGDGFAMGGTQTGEVFFFHHRNKLGDGGIHLFAGLLKNFAQLGIFGFLDGLFGLRNDDLLGL